MTTTDAFFAPLAGVCALRKRGDYQPAQPTLLLFFMGTTGGGHEQRTAVIARELAATGVNVVVVGIGAQVYTHDAHAVFDFGKTTVILQLTQNYTQIQVDHNNFRLATNASPPGCVLMILPSGSTA